MKKLLTSIVFVAVLSFGINADTNLYFQGGVSIIGKHTEYKDGNIHFESFFLSNTQCITLFNLDQPDVQDLSVLLNDMFKHNIKISHFINTYRNIRTDNWYPFNSGIWYPGSSFNQVPMQFLDVYTGEKVIVRGIK